MDNLDKPNDAFIELMEKSQEFSDIFNAAMKALEEDQEKFWNGLSKEDQLKAFCAVSRRIFDGELKQKGTYRYVLYQVFGFGPEAYAQAQEAGYLALHNAIVDEYYDRRIIEAFCKKNDIPDWEKKYHDFIL